ncbi:MAG: four helix bundle protein [Verrucomicrobiota bacterium]|nr:four helix bundle protein [Verrucomicrobiota bacterium]
MKEKENIEHPTSNTEHRRVQYDMEDESASMVEERVYDLEERLLEYSAAIIRLVRELPKDREANHVAGQLLRSGTAALPNHGEAEAAESPADFVHKLRLCLKELRETRRWLLLAQRVPLVESDATLRPLLEETVQLIRIFVASIRTAEKRANNKGGST